MMDFIIRVHKLSNIPELLARKWGKASIGTDGVSDNKIFISTTLFGVRKTTKEQGLDDMFTWPEYDLELNRSNLRIIWPPTAGIMEWKVSLTEIEKTLMETPFLRLAIIVRSDSGNTCKKLGSAIIDLCDGNRQRPRLYGQVERMPGSVIEVSVYIYNSCTPCPEQTLSSPDICNTKYLIKARYKSVQKSESAPGLCSEEFGHDQKGLSVSNNEGQIPGHRKYPILKASEVLQEIIRKKSAELCSAKEEFTRLNNKLMHEIAELQKEKSEVRRQVTVEKAKLSLQREELYFRMRKDYKVRKSFRAMANNKIQEILAAEQKLLTLEFKLGYERNELIRRKSESTGRQDALVGSILTDSGNSMQLQNQNQNLMAPEAIDGKYDENINDLERRIRTLQSSLATAEERAATAETELAQLRYQSSERDEDGAGNQLLGNQNSHEHEDFRSATEMQDGRKEHDRGREYFERHANKLALILNHTAKTRRQINELVRSSRIFS